MTVKEKQPQTWRQTQKYKQLQREEDLKNMKATSTKCSFFSAVCFQAMYNLSFKQSVFFFKLFSQAQILQLDEWGAKQLKRGGYLVQPVRSLEKKENADRFTFWDFDDLCPLYNYVKTENIHTLYSFKICMIHC